MKKKSVAINAILNMILTVSNFMFPLITFPYISRVLMAEGIGKVAFATSVAGYFTLVASLGIPTYGIRECAKVREDKEKLSKTVHELIIINAIMTAISLLLFLLITVKVPRITENAILMYINMLGIILNIIGVNWVYSALEEYAYITKRALLFKILSLIAIFLFIKNSDDHIIYAAILVGAAGGSNIMNFLNLKKIISFKNYKEYKFKKHLRGVLVFFAQSAAITIYTNLDSVMLGIFKGDFEVGLYAAACKIKYVLLALITSVGKVMLPRLSYYAENGRESEFSTLIVKNIYFVLSMSLPIIIFIIYTARECVIFLSGEGFIGAVKPLQILIPSILLIGLSTILGVQILTPRNMEIYALYAAIIGAVVNIIVNTALIPAYGVVGVAVGTLMAELSVLTYEIFILRVMIMDMIKKLDIKKYIVAIIASIASMHLCYSNLNMDNILVLAFSGGITMLIFMGTLFITKHDTTVEMVEAVKFNLRNSGQA